MESLDELGSSLAASFDPAANAWVALSGSRGVMEVPLDTDWQEVPRDALPAQAPPHIPPSGQAMIRTCWAPLSMPCSACGVYSAHQAWQPH